MEDEMMNGKISKAKDFKGAIKRLAKELKEYSWIIVVALILAALSSVLSIFSPNILSNITDEITLGLGVNTDNLESLVESIQESATTQVFRDIQIEGNTVTVSEQMELLEIMKNLNENAGEKELYLTLDRLPNSVKSIVTNKINLEAITSLVKILVTIYLFSATFSLIQMLCMAKVANDFAKKLRTGISKKINKLPLSYFDKNTTGDILSRVTNDVDTISQSMSESLGTLVSSVTLFVGTTIMMFVTNWLLALTAILSSIVGFSFMFVILNKSQKYFVKRQEELGKLNGHIEEIYSGLNVVKTYNGQQSATSKFDELNQRVYNCNRKSQFLSGLMQPIMVFIGNFGYVAVCIVGAILASKGYISFGVIIAFITYVRMFTSPLSQIAQAMTSMQSTAAASERVFEFCDAKEMQDESNITKTLNKENVKGKIEFKNVVFKYEDNLEPTIKGFCARALPGQKIAIVGPTGAGKTTMVNLLMKYYNIDSGEILIDDVSTTQLTRANIHSLFTMVLQDTWLFNGTVRENIVYNRKNVSEEKLQEVCDIVGVSHFIKTLPHGFDTILSDNESVSSGQRQLLTIARGMIENAPFLILDEATSNVDTRTEELVQSAMDILTYGKTSFIIAHRLSTIRNADLILVMKDGNIVEQGNHEQLMAKNGFYTELYNSQFELT